MDQVINYQNQANLLFATFKDYCQVAISEIAKWEELYVVKSNATGIVSMTGTLKAKDFIPVGQVLFSIIPDNNHLNAFAIANVSSLGLGRIEKGNRVIVRLDAWPYKQFGSLITKVDHIAKLPLPNEKGSHTFELTFIFKEPIKTTAELVIPLKPQEIGMARIITKDRRILERILDQFLQLIKINS